MISYNEWPIGHKPDARLFPDDVDVREHAVKLIAQRFRLTLAIAAVVVDLCGLGGRPQ